MEKTKKTKNSPRWFWKGEAYLFTTEAVREAQAAGLPIPHPAAVLAKMRRERPDLCGRGRVQGSSHGFERVYALAVSGKIGKRASISLSSAEKNGHSVRVIAPKAAALPSEELYNLTLRVMHAVTAIAARGETSTMRALHGLLTPEVAK